MAFKSFCQSSINLELEYNNAVDARKIRILNIVAFKPLAGVFPRAVFALYFL